MEKPVSGGLPFHYGWMIVFAGMLSVCACLGIGRFALGMLLPSMASTLDLSYSQMGFISTSNFVGYLVSVLASGHWSGRIGPRRLIFTALLIVGISMALVSRATAYYQVLALYTITGIGSGAANVPVMGLVSAWFSSARRGRAAGIIVIGSGFAIILSGRLIPFVNKWYGAEGWRTSWMVRGIIVIAISFISLLLIRNRPGDKGLKPLGADAAAFNPGHETAKADVNVYKEKVMYFLGLIYFLFGFTYVIYATFIVTTLVKERGFPESVAGNFWAMVGLLSLFSGPVFGTISDKLSRKTGLIIVFAFQMVAYLLVATGLPGFFLYLSIFFYGVVAWSIPSIMAAAVGDYVGSKKAATAFGLITFIFGFGQISGPAIAGILAEKTGGFSSSFYMAGAFAALAIVLTSFLKKPQSA
ncbi:MAG: MFS transporter [Nitrospirae bacterium]|nr:MFS transporter [Nitrospirota bacterium]